MAVGIILKFLAPIFAFYLFQKWLFKLFKGGGQSVFRKNDAQGRARNRASKGSEDVIEVCPECGNVKLPGHQCQYNT